LISVYVCISTLAEHPVLKARKFDLMRTTFAHACALCFLWRSSGCRHSVVVPATPTVCCFSLARVHHSLRASLTEPASSPVTAARSPLRVGWRQPGGGGGGEGAPRLPPHPASAVSGAKPAAAVVPPPT